MPCGYPHQCYRAQDPVPHRLDLGSFPSKAVIVTAHAPSAFLVDRANRDAHCPEMFGTALPFHHPFQFQRNTQAVRTARGLTGTDPRAPRPVCDRQSCRYRGRGSFPDNSGTHRRGLRCRPTGGARIFSPQQNKTQEHQWNRNRNRAKQEKQDAGRDQGDTKWV